MVISIGEILVDLFIDGENKTAFPGGAPFNLAANIAHFDGDISFYGAVGNDKYGKFLKDFALKNVPLSLIETLNDRHTSEAIVTLENGERSFRFNRDDGADYILSTSSLSKLDLTRAAIVHLGSLMLSYKEGVDFFYEAIEYIKKHSKARISFDINYRDDIFPSEEVAKDVFLKALGCADIIKFTEEELRLLSGEDDLAKAIKTLLKPNQIAFVTLGKEGSLFFGNNKCIHTDTEPLVPVDTTGAGDAFYSFILYSLDRGIDLDNDILIKKTLKKANFVGGFATQKKGAIGVVPSVKEIDGHFQNKQ